MAYALLVVLALAICGVVAYVALPYSRAHYIRIKSTKLRMEIKDWRSEGEPAAHGYTNDRERCYVAFTNILAGTNATRGIMILESSDAGGVLLGTEAGEIFFHGKGDWRKVQ